MAQETIIRDIRVNKSKIYFLDLVDLEGNEQQRCDKCHAEK